LLICKQIEVYPMNLEDHYETAYYHK